MPKGQDVGIIAPDPDGKQSDRQPDGRAVIAGIHPNGDITHP